MGLDKQKIESRLLINNFVFDSYGDLFTNDFINYGLIYYFIDGNNYIDVYVCFNKILKLKRTFKNQNLKVLLNDVFNVLELRITELQQINNL